MASYSDSSILSSDEFPNTSLSMTSSIDHQRSTSDELSSKPKQPNEVIGGSKNAPENDEMDELIQKRIKKIYKRLKVGLSFLFCVPE